MRKIIHIDMDCFFAAVEMRDNPTLKHVPLAIGGRPDQRGVISTANYIARQYGIHSAMSSSRAYQLCPSLQLIPGRMAVYREISLQIREVLRRYTDKVEPLSLDEAYLDVTDTTCCQGSATLIAQEIRHTIAQELNLTASAGVAPIKYLAKIASDMNKPNGQYVITPDNIDAFIRDLPLRKIPGVGKVMDARLHELGLLTGADIQRYPRQALLTQFGKFGHVLWERCHGIDSRPVSAERKRKSLGVEKTLVQDITHWSECENIIDLLFTELTRRWKNMLQPSRITGIGVKIKCADFSQYIHEQRYDSLDKTRFMLLAQQLWQTRRETRSVRLVGLHLNLGETEAQQQLVLEWE